MEFLYLIVIWCNLTQVDEIADILGVLPNENDFIDKEFYNKLQNERLFGTQYRIKGYGKIDDGLNILSDQFKIDPADNKIMREQVIRVQEEKLK